MQTIFAIIKVITQTKFAFRGGYFMDSNNMKKIGAVLKQLRNEKNLKQNDLADMLNVRGYLRKSQ